MSKAVILTGIRANNNLHIGNYLGALLPIVDLAKQHADNDYQINLFVPDLHSFTTPIDHGTLNQSIMNSLKVFVASGLPMDHPNVHVYRQSYVPAHSELTWIFDCFTGMGEMQRMTQFKDKSSVLGDDRISVGLFNYPVLMAADVLLYGAEYVPVGEDQTQHIEFMRDIGERFNKQFGAIFKIPKSIKEQHEFFGKDQSLRIKDLVDPTKKMSKMDEAGKGVIYLSDTAEEAERKIASATTDSLNYINYDKANQPGLANLMDILAHFSDQDINEVIDSYKGQTSYSGLKKDVSEALGKFLNNFSEALNSVKESDILAKLEESEKLMNEQANKVLYKVQLAVGLRS